MIGIGIFLFASPVCAYLLEPWVILCSWIMGSAIALCGAFCFSELCNLYPSQPGIYEFFRLAFGARLSFLYAWTKFFVMGVGCLSIAALASARFLIQVFDLSQDVASEISKPVALGLICFITLLNMLGFKKGSYFQNILTIPKLFCLVVIILVGCFFYFFHLEQLEPVFLAPQLEVNQFQNPSLVAFLSALVPILWAFGGWEDIFYQFDQTKVSKEKLGRALLAGVAIVSIFYLLINISYLMILSPLEIASAGSSALLLIKKTLGQIPGVMVAFFLMIIGLGVVNAALLTGARIPTVAGYHNPLFKWFCNVHPQTGTPQRAFIIQGLIAVFVVYLTDDIIALLVWTSIPYWGFLVFLGPCVLVSRVKLAQKRNYIDICKVRNIPPLLFTIASSLVFCFTLLEGFQFIFPATAILFIGGLAYMLQTHGASLKSIKL